MASKVPSKPSPITATPPPMPSAPRDRALDPNRSIGSGPSMGRTPVPMPTVPPKFNGDPGFSKTMPGRDIDPGIVKKFPGPSRDIDPGFSKTLPFKPAPKAKPTPTPFTPPKMNKKMP